MKKIKSEVKKNNRFINQATRYKLWGKSAGRCQLCNRIVYTDSIFGRDGNFGELAHIHAVGKKGPRHAEDMVQEELNNTNNLMLLCQEHHKMIDDNPDIFPSGYLLEKKKAHENRIFKVTSINNLVTCKMVSYCTRIDDNEIFRCEKEFKKALLGEDLIPEQDKSINLASIFHDDLRTKEMYVAKAHELAISFKKNVEDITRSNESIAIFAFGPIPLLIKLGTLINDQYNTKVFQRHRVGEEWSWRNTDNEVEYLVEGLDVISEHDDIVAINLSLSASINNNRIVSIVGKKVPIVTLTLKNPNRDFATREDIVDLFVKDYRKMLEEIKYIANLKKVLLFPAIPVSLAVRLGQDYMKKTDPIMVIYDQDGEKFVETITIGGEECNG